MPSANFPYVFSFRGNHGKRVFPTPVELSDWVKGEQAAYRDFAAIKPHQAVEPFLSMSKALRNLDAAQGHAEGLKNLPFEDSTEFSQLFNALNQSLTVAYHNKGIPPSDSVAVSGLRPALAEEPHVALAALCASTSPQDNVHFALVDPVCARGIGLASVLRFSTDGSRAVVAVGQVVDSTIASLKLRADETDTRVLEQIRLANDAQLRAHSVWDTHNEDYTKLSGSLQQKVDSKIEEANNAISDFTTAHQAEISLREPVLFWERKGKAHQVRARWFATIGLAAALLFAFGAVTQLPKLLTPVSGVADAAAGATQATNTGATAEAAKPIQVPLASPGGGAPSYYGIALAVVLTTLALWLLRILVRGYFSQTHLATDAEERVAMVKTYLALMESGKAPSDTLTPVLVALFRPASDGIVKDDSMPMGVAEFLTKPKSGN